MRFRTLALAALSAVTFTATAPAVSAQAGSPNDATVVPATEPTYQVIVTYRNGADRADPGAELSADGADLTVERDFGTESVVVSLDAMTEPDELNQVMADLADDPNVVSVQPDAILRGDTNDPYWDQMWNLQNPGEGGQGIWDANQSGIGVQKMWEVTTGSEDVYVAVLDSGITDHPDLKGRWVGGYDFVSNVPNANDGDARDADPHDPGNWVSQADQEIPDLKGCRKRNSNWHGTHVAGTIAASTNNGVGIAGVNQVSKVVPVRVLGKCGGTVSDIADAIRWSAGLPVADTPTNPHKADVINMSLGAVLSCDSDTFRPMKEAITDAYNAGTSVVVSAGNSNIDASKAAPAGCAEVVTVAALGRYGERARYSNWGDSIEVAAPGGDVHQFGPNRGGRVISTINLGTTVPAGHGYQGYQGTSMAAPHVAGVVSLMKSANPNLTPAEITRILTETARPYPDGSSCVGRCGAGIVDSAALTGVPSKGGSGLENLALKGTAYQSSTKMYGDAGHANDGGLSSIWMDVSLTTIEAQPYWEVHLDASATIEQIRLWNRLDCCKAGLNDFWLFASNEPFTSLDPNVVANDPNVKALHIQGVAGQRAEIDFGGYEAEYIRIQRDAKNQLNLAEVQVFGTRTEEPSTPPTNLAPDGTATASSIHWDSDPSNAIDGNTSGVVWPDGSVTMTQRQRYAHWDLTLKESSTIDDIVVWNRAECCRERLQGAWVFASNKPFTSTNPNVLAKDPNVSAKRIEETPKPFVSFAMDGYQARYVRLQLDDTDVLHMGEVQVFGTPGGGGGGGGGGGNTENLAPKGTASQSSTWGGLPASRANDGSTAGVGRESQSHTQKQDFAYWDVRLDSSATVDDIVVWRRTDCCANRIQDFWVFASNKPFASTNPNVLARDPNVSATRIQGFPDANATVNLGGYQAQYVRVQLNGKNFLQLAEVQVFGTPTDDGTSSENLGPKGTASQSSTWGGQLAERANDGSTDGGGKTSSSHTQKETHAHWDLTLNSSATVDDIVVWRRSDCCANRIQDFWVFASNKPFTSNDPNVLARDPNVKATRVQGFPDVSTTVDLGGYQAQYVRVQLNGRNFLQLAEVQVFGTPT